MKKIIALFLSLLMLFMVFPVSAVDTAAPTFALGTASAKAGGTVQIPVTVSNNTGIVAMKVMIAYDADVLSFTGATYSSLFSGGDALFGNDLSANPYNLLWIDPLSKVNYTDNGTFAVLNFTVNANAPVGDTAITLTYEKGSTFDVGLNEAVFTTQNGTVTVLPDETGGWHFDESSTLRILKGESGLDFVVGLDEVLPSISEFVVTTGGWSFEVIPNDENAESTGAELVIYDEKGADVEHYYAVLYGDVNGNGLIDLMDASVIVSALNTTKETEWENALFSDEYPQTMAADLTHNGIIELDDVSFLVGCLLGSETLDQCWAGGNN